MSKGQHHDARKPGTVWSVTASRRWYADTATSPSEDDSTSGSTDGGTSAQSDASATSKALKGMPRLDTRKPGTAWSPVQLRRAAQATTPRRVPKAIAEKYSRPEDEIAARTQLEKAIKQVFGEVEARGKKALEEKTE